MTLKPSLSTAMDKLQDGLLWKVHGRYYDLRNFDHPGGRLVIEQSRGADVTALFESHHFTDAALIRLRDFAVPECSHGETSKSIVHIPDMGYSFKDDGFFRTLKRRLVAEVGAKTLRAPPPRSYAIRVCLTLAVHALTWFWCIFFPFSWIVAIVAFFSRVSLIGIGHEAIHGRYGDKLFHLFDAMFCFSSVRWHYEHVICHHPHTRRDGHDPDEILPPWMRLNPKSPWLLHHRFQELVQLMVGSVASLGNYIDNHLLPRQDIVMGTVFLGLRFAPLWFAPDGGWKSVLIVEGFGSALTLCAFHISHINFETDVHEFQEGMDWGEHQLRTSVNWESSEWSLSGMLEHQIEHHLFPSLPYDVQRYVLRPLVKETAANFGIPYVEHSNSIQGLWRHCAYIHALGVKDEPREEPGQPQHSPILDLPLRMLGTLVMLEPQSLWTPFKSKSG